MTGGNKKILVKLSGDLYSHPQVYKELNAMPGEAVVHVILGFGTEYGKRLDSARIPFHYENDARVIDDREKEQDALRIGRDLQTEMQSEFKRKIPRIAGFLDCISDEEGTLTNINGDDVVRRHYKEYGEVVVYTLNERDKSNLETLGNVRIVYLDRL